MREEEALSMVSKALPIASSSELPPHQYEELLRATIAIAGYRDIRTFRERFASELYRLIPFDYVLVKILDGDTLELRGKMFHAPKELREITMPEFQADET